MAATRVRSQDIGDGEVKAADLGVLTTKGDILAFSTLHVRLPVGSDGQYLVADSAQTPGIKWAAFSGLTASNFVFNEVPGGTIDGSNAAFTLANTPTAGTERLYKNGIRQKSGAGNDYTISAGTITFLAGNIPQTGDVLLADYMK